MSTPPGAFTDAFVNLLHSSHRLHPDDLPGAVAHEAARIDFDDALILLSDLEQRVLIPFTGDSNGELLPEAHSDIDGSMAGRAYRTEMPLVGERADGRTPLWFPLLDSAERLGVLAGSTAATVDDVLIGRLTAFSSLVAELIANKSSYGDVVARLRRTRPLTLSAELRWAMLPPLTFSGRNLTISGVLEPAYSIAGDTFDYAVNGDLAHLAIIDAIGHGLEASRIANLAVAAYRNGRRDLLDLPDLYRVMDAAVADQFDVEKYATAQLATLELATGRLSWLNAGHPPPMVIRQHSRIELEAPACLPVGVSMGEIEPEASATVLEPGDIVLFFTDGVVEARSPDGEEFGRDRLADLLTRAAAALQTPAETVRRLAHAVLDHQQAPLADDGTLLLVVWHGPPAQTQR